MIGSTVRFFFTRLYARKVIAKLNGIQGRTPLLIVSIPTPKAAIPKANHCQRVNFSFRKIDPARTAVSGKIKYPKLASVA